MQNNKEYIPSDKIKQVFLLAIIVVLLGVMAFNLSMFIPALLGAVTLYVVARDFNFYLQEKRKWKPWIASLFVIFIYILVFVVPSYFLIDLIVRKAIGINEYLPEIEKFMIKVQDYVMEMTDINVSSKENLKQLANYATGVSTQILSGTLSTFSVVAAMFFMLYFMLQSPRQFERVCTSAIPFKRANNQLVGLKFRKLLVANAVGIPVVALGQGLVALLGYWFFDVPNAMLWFALTAVTSMIPIVGGAIVFVPVSLYLMAEGNIGGGVALLAYCVVVVGLTDNVLRFTLLKKLEDIHPLNTVFGIIMGMNLFGFMGLIFGPILVSMTVLLMQIYRDEFSDKDNTVPPLQLTEEEEFKEKVDLSI